jgi:hypothetical protein
MSVHLPYKSGIPRDVAINTFYFAASDTLLADPPTLVTALHDAGTALIDMYNANLGGIRIGDYIGNFVDRSHCYVTLAELSAAALTTPGGAVTFTPLASSPFTLAGTPSYNSLPLEVAAVSSVRGMDTFPGTTFPPSIRRRRGRFYLGPLNISTIETETDSRPTFTASFRTRLAIATKGLQAAVDAIDGLAWVVWSRTAAGVSIITEGYINDEPDTQRRRGSGETARSTWSI